MRILMWFTMGFALSCGICAALLRAGLIPVLLVSAILLMLGSVAGRKHRQMRVLFPVAAGTLAGLLCFFLFDSVYLSAAKAQNETQSVAVITASDYSYETDYGVAVDGILMLHGKPYQLRVYLDAGEGIAPGDRICGNFRFRVTTPEGLDSHHPGKGIFLMAYQRGETEIQPAEQIPRWCFPAVLRQQIRGILQQTFPADVYPFAKALLLGESYDLPYETDTALKISGIRHIVAVSGLHVSLLYSIIHAIMLKRRFLTSLLGFPVLLLFAALAGFTPSVCRAALMLGILMLSQLLDREYDPPTALAFAVLLMLVCNPLVITSAGFQLSVSSVAGILLLQAPLSDWLKSRMTKKNRNLTKLHAGILSSVSVTISAMSLTIPHSAGYFGTVSLVSMVTNFLSLWLVELIFIGIVLACVLSLLSMKLAVMLGGALAWAIRALLFGADAISRFPLAAVYTQSVYVAAWLVFSYLLVFGVLLSGKKHIRKAVCCCLLGLCLALGCSWLEPLLHSCRVTMLDVGQGQCILLQSRGRNFLVDCGGDNAESAATLAEQTLLSQGITRLDGVIVTHYDADHFAGIPLLLRRVKTDLLFLPDTADEGKRDLLPAHGGQTILVGQDIEISFETGKLRLYGPVYSGYSNENSLCVLFDTENCDILITGDRGGFGERMLLRKQNLPDVDVLVAGHHGAENSTTEELLYAVRPETVLISVSADNAYGHPHAAVLKRLAQFGCAVYRTDQSGTILYRR